MFVYLEHKKYCRSMFTVILLDLALLLFQNCWETGNGLLMDTIRVVYNTTQMSGKKRDGIDFWQ